MALRTRTDLVETIAQRVKDEHAYEVPSVVALPIIAGNPDYLDWIRTETQDSGEPR